MKIIKLSIILLLPLLVNSCASCSQSGRRSNAINNTPFNTTLSHAPNIDDQYLTVVKISDGDTFWADDGSPKGVKIRLIGIDAPECKNVFKKRQGFYGKESKEYLTNILSG